MGTSSEPALAVADDPPPTVVVDDLHVRYRVLATASARRGPSLRTHRTVEALKGISFVARQGDAIGIVGRNGSGKSTLLRCIAGLMPPTSGSVWAKGHPQLLGVNAALIRELSGERNVVLGCLALGMTPAQIRARYDDIVEFADLEGFMDLPMRTYSSGMGARLRFAIATAATPDILLVDEALATGDQQFRQRSEQRIRDLRSHAGTVFLVSHGLGAIAATCSRVIWIDRGELRMDGGVAEVLEAYRASVQPPKPAASDAPAPPPVQLARRTAVPDPDQATGGDDGHPEPRAGRR